MTSDAIYEKLTEILREMFNDDTLVATAQLTADDVPAWDSFAHLRLIFAVEESFAVDFSASQIASLETIGDLAELIRTAQLDQTDEEQSEAVEHG